MLDGYSGFTAKSAEPKTEGTAPKDTKDGVKYDANKLEYGLLPPYALDDVVKVLTFGAQKYSRENWRYVEDAHRRYFDAMQRHLWAYKRGEMNDPETRISHMAHAICCAMFIAELDKLHAAGLNAAATPAGDSHKKTWHNPLKD